MAPHRGNDKSYLTSRLTSAGKRAHLAAIENGSMSVYAAAVDAGLRTRPETSGTSRRSSASKRRTAVAYMLRGEPHPSAELQELWLGVGNQPSVFNSDDACRSAWARHRAVLMQQYGSHGRRPLAWWRYEAGNLRWSGYERERSTLYDANKLTAIERSEQEAYWRSEFAVPAAWRILTPPFATSSGSTSRSRSPIFWPLSASVPIAPSVHFSGPDKKKPRGFTGQGERVGL